MTFRATQQILMDGISGSGKSSIVDALIWALYGKARVDNRYLVKKNTTSATVIVTLVDDTDGKEFVITRVATLSGKHTLNVEENGKPVEVLGLKKMQDHIDRDILKSSYLLFVNSIIYPQDSVDSFIGQPANKRKDILMEIVGGHEYDEYLKRAKEVFKEVDEKRIEYITKRQVSKKIIDEEASVKEHLETEKEQLSVEEGKLIEKDAEMKKIEEDIKQREKDLEKREGKMNEYNSGIEEHKKLLGAIAEAKDGIVAVNDVYVAQIADIKTIKAKLLRLREASDKALKWHRDMAKIISKVPVHRDFDAEIKEAKESIAFHKADMEGIMDANTIECDKCSNVMNLMDKSDKLRERIERKKSAIKFVQETLDKKKKEQEEHNKIASNNEVETRNLGACPIVDGDKIKELESDLALIQKAESDIKTNNVYKQIVKEKEDLAKKALDKSTELLLKIGISNGDKLKGELYRLNSAMSTTKIDIDRIKLGYDEAKLLIRVAEKKLIEIEREKKNFTKYDKLVAETMKDVELLNLMKEVFGPNGLKSVVIDYIIPQLEGRINKILSQLSEFRVKLDTQKRTVSGVSVMEGLFIKILNEKNEELDFNNYSGGEKLKITVAISEALAEVQNTGFRILDELFIGLDEESTENFAEVMSTLQNKFSQLICISHLTNIKDMFDERMLVTKVNGSSTISI